MPRRNPLALDSWLPTTGNPFLDALARNVAGQGAQHVLARMNPAVQEAARTVWAALEAAELAPPAGRGGVVRQNPAAPRPSGDKARFMAELLAARTGLWVTLGRRGSGKTSFDLKLAQEYHKRGRPVFVIGMPAAALQPFDFRAITPAEIDRLPNGAVLVIDDVALFFSNRDYAKAGLLHKLIIESRHRDIVIVINAHNSALIDKYLLEATGLFLKPSSTLTQDLQRSGIRDLVRRADEAFRRLPREVRKSRIYAWSDELDFEGMLTYTPPKGWSERVSQHHARGRS